MDTTLRALNRFGMGASIGERQDIADPREWLRGQLTPSAALVTGGVELADISLALAALRAAQRTQDAEELRAARGRIQRVVQTEYDTMFTQRVVSETPFVERLVAFWSNHLCVSMSASRQVAGLAGHYERTVVRRHVLGRFEDMVLASARHPAMLFYLDNFQSIGPGSMPGRQTARRGRGRGLNENYARELLELHTVGVDGGYGQQDVEELAEVLTGWTIEGLGPGAPVGESLGFVFRPILHEPGPKTVMGELYAEGGAGEGERVIRDLCRHPSTATFLAEKLVRHFVSDDPPAPAVDRLARVFRESDGDLAATARALVDLDEAWDPASRKFRTPQDWLVAVFRTFRVTDVPETMGPLTTQLRHAPWAPGAPKGYGDSTREWADPDSLMNRAELARTVSRRFGSMVRLDPELLLGVVDVPPGDPLRTLLADDSITRPERIALLIGGPAFQWR